jgi:predicted O-methyltransferase YrrM
MQNESENRTQASIQSVIDEIYRDRFVVDRFGQRHELHSEISPLEGDYLAGLIRADESVLKTLEIGFGFGLSALHICSALVGRQSARHLALDPAQDWLFHDAGLMNIEKSGIDFFELVPRPSEFALPDLAEERPNSFDLIFVDGMHTMDHVLMDIFFASKLVRVGGYIVLDDCNLPSIAKAVSYTSKYPAYRIHSQCPTDGSLKRKLARVSRTLMPQAISGYLLPRNLHDLIYIRTLYSSMVTLQKIKEDTYDDRDWDWFVPF